MVCVVKIEITTMAREKKERGKGQQSEIEIHKQTNKQTRAYTSYTSTRIKEGDFIQRQRDNIEKQL